MADDRKISLCIPTWNRFELLIDSFINVLHDDRIFEIVICDDASDNGSYEKIQDFVSGIKKVKLFRNSVNLDCYRNKNRVISFSDNNTDGCILLDSDNIIGKDYLDKLYEITEWKVETIYTPSFAAPHFDFRAYEGLVITKSNVAEYIDKPMFEVMLNAANYFVHPLFYLEAWDGTVDPITSDSIFQCYNWLIEGFKINVVPGLTYQHRVHEGSHYRNNVNRTPNGFHESILNKLRNLKA